uniref:Uncharacterized protein n=1 Tax=Arundo donax TaxID=35708 RepID=A0A0A9AQZ0_ARUDO
MVLGFWSSPSSSCTSTFGLDVFTEEGMTVHGDIGLAVAYRVRLPSRAPTNSRRVASGPHVIQLSLALTFCTRLPTSTVVSGSESQSAPRPVWRLPVAAAEGPTAAVARSRSQPRALRSTADAVAAFSSSIILLGRISRLGAMVRWEED